MRVRLTRRLGQNLAGSVLDYRDSEAHWLVSQGHAVPEAQQPDPSQQAEAEQHGSVDTAVDESDDGPSRKELQAKAEGLGLKTYGTKAQLAARIATREAASATDV